MTGRPPIRVRLERGERAFETWTAVEKLVKTGDITGQTPVCADGSGRFVPARSVPELAGQLDVDPWSAWDDADEDSIKEALEGFAAEVEDFDGDLPTAPDVPVLPAAPLELGAEAVQPLDRPPAPARPEVEELPPAALAPMEEPSRRAPPPSTASARLDGLPARGKVIAFPDTRAASSPSRGGGAVAEPVPLHPVQEPPVAPPLASLPAASPPSAPGPSRTRWGRIVGIGVLAVTAMLLLNSWVTSTATLSFPPLEAPGGAPDAGAAVAAAPPAGEAPVPPQPAAARATNRMADLEREIRGQWLVEPREVVDPGDLEDALYVELPRVHIDLVKARAPITRWGGRKNATPQAANFLVRYRARPGELDRELAAIGLVVGRYLSIYRISGEQFTVEIVSADDSIRRVAIDPKAALRLYEQRIDIVAFLEELAR